MVEHIFRLPGEPHLIDDLSRKRAHRIQRITQVFGAFPKYLRK
jgi:hypothetical protein